MVWVSGPRNCGVGWVSRRSLNPLAVDPEKGSPGGDRGWSQGAEGLDEEETQARNRREGIGKVEGAIRRALQQ